MSLQGRSIEHGSILWVGLVSVFMGCGADSESDPPRIPEVAAPARPFDADIFLADVRWDPSGTPTVGTVTNLTGRPGYDNQPHFLPDGSGLWYTAVDENDGQADIWRYQFDSGMVTRVTLSNPESEYSATPLPDGSGISTIRVEADSTQRLWRFDLDGSNASVMMEGIDPVGYHAWADPTTVVMFVLGEPTTLRRGDTSTGDAVVLAQDIGRAIQRIPESNDISYVQRHADGTTTIMRLPGDGSEAVPVIEAIEGGDYHAWAPNGTLFMAHESIVYAVAPGSEETWKVVGDFSPLHMTISRLAVSPDGAQIALVGEPDMIGTLPGS